MNVVLRILINAVAIWLATQVLDRMEVVGGDDTTTTVLVLVVLGLVFGVVNAVVRPIVRAISFPLYVVTLGLFTLVVNALMLWLTGWLSEQTDYGLRIDDFGTAFLGALLISVVSFVLNLVVPKRGGRRRRRRSRD